MGVKENFSAFDFIWCQSFTGNYRLCGDIDFHAADYEINWCGRSKGTAQCNCTDSSLMIVITGFRHINWKEFFKMFVLMAAGMVVGMKIFEVFPMQQLLTFYGIMIIVIALDKLFVKKQLRLPAVLMLFVIFAAGIIHGMFVSGGALLVIYAAGALKDKEEFRATIALIWLTIGCYITGIQFQAGHFNSHVWFLLIAGIIPVFAGTWIGTKLVKKLPQEIFMKMTYILLLLSGVMAIV